MVDPRTSVIEQRLAKVKNVIAVSSGKGGVGKSLVASTLALLLVKRSYRVGLFDLDFTSPSTHVILGVEDVQPKEEEGIIPPRVHGLEYMSIVYYTGDRPTPLRGADVSNALVELLSITKWGELDYLLLDTPPGIGDATLDLLRFVKNLRFLVVTTSSQLAFETVRKLSRLFRDLNIPVIGVVENMKMTEANTIRHETRREKLDYLGEIPYDPDVESVIGDVAKLLDTAFAKRLDEVVQKI